VVGNVLECLRPDFHHVILDWADRYGGIFRAKFLWQDALVVTDPAALAAIMGRGEGAMDKAALVYAPINKMCDPHANANLLTSAADDDWKAVRKAVAVSFSMQVRGGGPAQMCWHCPAWARMRKILQAQPLVEDYCCCDCWHCLASSQNLT
jgi:cytochrome P450